MARAKLQSSSVDCAIPLLEARELQCRPEDGNTGQARFVLARRNAQAKGPARVPRPLISRRAGDTGHAHDRLLERRHLPYGRQMMIIVFGDKV